MPKPLNSQSKQLHDPKVLRAISHPLRARILDELTAAGSMRAADVAQLLDIPANQASFHLRQLAKYGLITEAPDEARDGRDRVWKVTSPHGYSLDIDDIATRPGGKAVVTVWRRQATARAHDTVEAAYSAKREKGVHVTINDSTLRLSSAEAVEMISEMTLLIERWQERGAKKGGDAERRTYHVMQILQPYPEA